MDYLQILLFNLEIDQERYEKMKERVIHGSSKYQLHHINGIIEGLQMAINAARSLNLTRITGNKMRNYENPS